MNDNIFWRMIVYFAPLSFLTIGGGTSVIADMHKHTVNIYQWLSDAEFLNIFALSRLAPGPGTLIVPMIGWKVAGFTGALVSSVAIFLPSSLLVFGLARYWNNHRGEPWQKAIETGLTPIAAGMVLASSFTLLQAATGGLLAWAVAGLSLIALIFTRINPLYLIAAGGVIFAIVLR
ncbi:chromate transporter [Rhizobium binxianense]